MEQELHSEEESSSKFENLHKVTPVSKYLAMGLFISLPFIGGWVGYTFAPEKIVEVENIVEVEVEKEVQKSEQHELDNEDLGLTLAEICARNSSAIRESNGDYILRAEPSSWETQYDIITKITNDERRGVLCKYNSNSDGYEFYLNLTNVDYSLFTLGIIKYFNELPLGDNIYLTTSQSEGLQYAPLLKINITKTSPELEDTGLYAPNHPGFVISPNKENMVLINEDMGNQLYLFNVPTGKSKLIHEIDPTQYTYFKKDGYGQPRYRVEWLDDKSVRIRAVAIDKNDLTEALFVPNGDELSYDELARTGDLIERVIDISQYRF